jgi:hypothetical protein
LRVATPSPEVKIAASPHWLCASSYLIDSNLRA